MRTFFMVMTTACLVLVLSIIYFFPFLFVEATPLSPEIKEEYTKYREMFDDMCGEDSRKLKVEMAPLGFNPLAYCQTSIFGDEYNKIVINSQEWEGLNHTRRKLLIWHELGHCILKRTHKEHPDKPVPVSIMNPYIDIELELWYLNNPSYYEAELCGGH